jgi:hypothetical protein
MTDKDEEIKKELNEECVLKVFNAIKENEEKIKGIPPAEVLISLGTSLLGNLIQNFISNKASDMETHKACKIFLSAIGLNVQKGFDEMFGVKEEEKKVIIQ